MRRFTLAALACLAICRPMAAEEKYYMITFASQREDNVPRFTHTWAAFVKVKLAETSDGDDAPAPEIETVTISWLPASGVIVPRLTPEAGRNFTLAQTLSWAKELGVRISAFTPVEIKKELFDLARERKRVLDSGRLGYKMIDLGVRPLTATNCIHAVSDMVPGTLLVTGTARGNDATALVTRHLMPYVVDAKNAPTDLADRLGLGDYRINWLTVERERVVSD